MNNISTWIKNFGPAALLLGMTVLPAAAATQPTKNIILVHGAWADGSSWSKVIPLLDAKGYNVTAVQLPLTSLSDDAATVKRALALESGPVLLVAHSYGGAVITEAGNDPKVTGLVYVAAFAPAAGQSVGSLNATVPPTPLATQAKPDAEGFVKISKAGIFDDFAQDLSTTEKEVLYVAEAPTNVKSLGGTIDQPAWQNKPSWYIVAANDRAISPKLEATMAQTIHATTETIKSSHVVMLSHPREVAEMIERAAEH